MYQAVNFTRKSFTYTKKENKTKRDSSVVLTSKLKTRYVSHKTICIVITLCLHVQPTDRFLRTDRIENCLNIIEKAQGNPATGDNIP